MTTGLSSALAVAGVFLFFAIVRGSTNRPAQRDAATGDLVLQCSGIFVWTMGLGAVGGPVSMAILTFFFPFKNEREVFIPIGLGAFFLVLGGLMCFWAIRRRTRISGRGLTSEYMLARPQFLPWEEVIEVSFANGQEFWVHGADGKKAMFQVFFFRGVKEAVPLLLAHLPQEVQDEYHETIDRFICATGAHL